MTNFSQKVLQITAKIPKGKTLAYKEVARLAGKPRAYRAVGQILSKNYNPKIPCHRVVKSNGSIGGYNRGQKAKISLLAQENVKVKICRK